MGRPQEQLADALVALKALQAQGVIAIRSRELSRSHRERLVRAGFLKRVLKGWYIPSRPEETGDGETTSWYAAFWAFCAEYLGYRFGEEWSLSPEQSLLLHAGNRTVPTQLLVRSPKARNNVTALVHGTSILEVRAQIAQGDTLETIGGLRTFNLAHALVNISPRFFSMYPMDARTVLTGIRDASEVLNVLLEGEHNTVAGRLAGAFRNIGRGKLADDILKAFRAAGYTITESDPFTDQLRITLPPRERSPYVNRLHTNWQAMRDDILKHFPEPPGLPDDRNAYLKTVDDIYVTDAYHSLSVTTRPPVPKKIRKNA